jgi:hypothetical protein
LVETLETVLVFVPLEEAVVVGVEAAEGGEEHIFVVLGHLDVRNLEVAQMAELTLAAERIRAVIILNFADQNGCKLPEVNFSVLVGLRVAQENWHLEGSQRQLLAIAHDCAELAHANFLTICADGLAFVDDELFKFGQTGVHDSAFAKFITDVVEILFEVSKFDLFIALLDHVVAQKSVHLLLADPGAGAEAVPQVDEGNLSGVLFGLRVDVVLLETAQNELVALLDFEFVNELQSLSLDVTLALFDLCQLLVALQEDLDCLDTDGDEFLPRDFAVRVFVGESEENADVALAQVVLVELFEGLKELLVLQFAVGIVIVFREKLD